MTKVVGTFLLVTISFIIYHVILFKRRKSPIPKSNHCFFGIEERLAGFKYNIDRWGGKGRGYTGGVDRYVLFMVVSQRVCPSMDTGERALFLRMLLRH